MLFIVASLGFCKAHLKIFNLFEFTSPKIFGVNGAAQVCSNMQL